MEGGVCVAVWLARFLCLDIRARQSRGGIMLVFRHRFLTSLASAPYGATIAPLRQTSAGSLASSVQSECRPCGPVHIKCNRGHLLEYGSVLTYDVSWDAASPEGVS
ncbi:hypothetical protein KIPB_012770 [Kipferlia bialata]|uniref:Uncharacterized protein n=1 Tax=Kipferlia bialata TaxID=797122 RepID=A0A9K3D7L7_9EUKA|nr:hypothetical protein KIPB_012770 [Kipferlia bialata]|eukprot:g12770.t1